ncbi:hypothetical protein [Lactococcus petauri]|uniref:hypothetical protein n=1 Tax=Lactococcus petauri TaxID=1940789 RepID=UPI001F56B313|nr:hypothetical protein [Lactococcus petauri]
MNKKTFLTFLFGILAVGIGILAYCSMTSSKGTEHSSASSVRSFEQVESNGSRQKIKLNTSSPKQSASQESKKVNKTEKVKQERKAFNKEILSQNYYVEHVDDKGNLTYIKATEKELQELETNNSSLSTYQVNYDGQLISVLATPERN